MGTVKVFNTPRLASKFKIRFQAMPYGLALKLFTLSFLELSPNYLHDYSINTI